MKSRIHFLSSLTLLSILILGCDKEDSSPNTLPGLAVSTNSISSITTETATGGGNVSDDGGETVTAKGICWSVDPDPTIDLPTKTNDGTDVGSYVSNMSGLSAGTLYYVRAYASNLAGTAYGNQVIFTTDSGSVPVLLTNSASNITNESADCGGVVILDGDLPITGRGLCWSTSANPTISSDSALYVGSGTGEFSGTLTDLAQGVTYYVRAFATNSSGTGYGNQISFTTDAGLIPTLFTTSASNITYQSAQAGGGVTFDGGLPVNQNGLCWGTTENPTISSGSVLIVGSGTNDFSGNMTDLMPNTTYFVRAFATNAAGTGYGNSISFSTSPVQLGDSYGGGIVAYIYQPGDPGYSENVQHGLICPSVSLANLSFGCNSSSVSGLSSEIGSGNANTLAIINACGTNNAAGACANYSLNGFSDWFLPSRLEFEKICENQAASGIDQTNWSGQYWTSSQFNSTDSWFYQSENCDSASEPKSNAKSVKPTRSF